MVKNGARHSRRIMILQSTSTGKGPHQQILRARKPVRRRALPQLSAPSGASFYVQDALSPHNLANHPRLLLTRADEFENELCLLRRHYHRHADAHVEYLIQLLLTHSPFGLDKLEDGQHFPRSSANHDIAMLGQDTGDVVDKPSASNVGKAFDGRRDTCPARAILA